MIYTSIPILTGICPSKIMRKDLNIGETIAKHIKLKLSKQDTPTTLNIEKPLPISNGSICLERKYVTQERYIGFFAPIHKVKDTMQAIYQGQGCA